MSSALVNYAASELGPTAMDAGVALGKYLAEQAAAKAKTWATKPRPAKKRKTYKTQTRGMARVGDRVGSANSKWDTLSVDYTNMSPETLNQLPLLSITKFEGSSAYDRRLKDQVNFRGIKFCLNFRCEGALGTAKAMLNVAVISPKTDIASSNPIPVNDFWRDPSGSRRAVNFNDAGLISLDYHCNAINTDKYIVHKRIKHMIGPSGSTEGQKEKYIEFYMPVNRQIRYENGTSNPEGKNTYMVWWFSASDGGAPLNSVRFSYRVTRYFKESLGI